MRLGENFCEYPPASGEPVQSFWRRIPDLSLVNPWRHTLRTTGDIASCADGGFAFSFTERDRILTINRVEMLYKQKFGWLDAIDLDGPANHGLWSVSNGRPHAFSDIERMTKRILDFARSETYTSWLNSDLRIMGEISLRLWEPDTYSKEDHDTDPHQDWTTIEPVLIVLASRAYTETNKDYGRSTEEPPVSLNLWDGSYLYRGDLQDKQGYQISYLKETLSMEQLKTEDGQVWVADGRRGLHARPTMEPNSKPFYRLFMRAFITEAG